MHNVRCGICETIACEDCVEKLTVFYRCCDTVSASGDDECSKCQKTMKQAGRSVLCDACTGKCPTRDQVFAFLLKRAGFETKNGAMIAMAKEFKIDPNVAELQRKLGEQDDDDEGEGDEAADSTSDDESKKRKADSAADDEPPAKRAKTEA